MERVGPSWQTRSTEPISMPSSSEAVATRALSSPRFSRFSASRRSLAERLPWCDVTLSAAQAAAPRWCVTRSASRRVLTKTSVVAVRLDQLRQPGVDLVPDLVRHDRFQRRAGQLDRQVQLSALRVPRSSRWWRCATPFALPVPRPGIAPLPRSASALRRGRSAARALRQRAPAVPCSTPGASRGDCPPRHEFRPRSACGPA